MPDSDVAYDPFIPLCPSELSTRKRFEQNEKESLFFSKIRVEIRLLIYEYALCYGESVWPQQVAPRSNKFLSPALYPGHFRYRSMKAHGKIGVFPINHLKTTSRQIFWELEQYQVFYRVNDFEFDHLDDFHAFLGSLTLAKRHALTTIRVQFDMVWLENDDDLNWPFGLFWDLDDGPQKDSIITLLRDCKSLRNLVLDVGQAIVVFWDDPTAEELELQAREILEGIGTLVRGGLPREKMPAEFLWQFPQFRMALNLPYLSNINQPWEDTWIRRDLRFNSERVFNIVWKPIYRAGADMPFDAQYGWMNEKTSYLESILEIDTILQQLRSTRPTTLPTTDELSKAYAATNLDAPGNMRVVGNLRTIGG